ncbi:hypothetical protein JYU12_01825 [bacterium AH-315-K03]|nr:hypothetical protein [bacterium AH-315-K03]
MKTQTPASFLLSTAWLEEHLNDPLLRIFDCTGCIGKAYINHGRQRHYQLHHIPGAVYLDVANPKGELSDPHGALPCSWPTPDQIKATMAGQGVSNKHVVILYSGPNPNAPGSGISWATRAWWILHHHGVPCYILDGGWSKWCNDPILPMSNPATEV